MSTKYIASNWRLLNKAGVDSYKNDNYGLSFNGSNEYIDLDIQSLNTPATISIWVNTAVNDSQQRYAIINGRADQEPTVYLRMQSDNTYQVFLSNTNGSDTLQASAATINTWFHFVIVCEDSQTLLYENGVLKDSSTIGWSGINIDQSNNWELGRDSRGMRFWSGTISECAFFNYALTSTQISTLYGSSSLGAGNPMALPTPVAYYPLGDNSASNPLTQPNEAVEDASVFDFVPNDDINCGTNSIFDITENITLSGWINRDDNLNLSTIITKWNSGPTDTAYILRVGSSGGAASNSQIQMLIRNTSGVSVTATEVVGEVCINKWVHIMGTYNGSTIRLFYNGVELGSGTAQTGNIETSTAPLRIGSRGSEYIDGKMSNVAIWNSDQSSEISNIYNSGVPATSYTNTPTAWYKLDQSANWEADSSGAWQIPDAVSAYPQSFDFDGSSEIINLGNDASLYPQTGDMSYSFWVNPDVLSGYQTIYGLVGMGTGVKGVNINLFGSEVRVFMGVGVGGQWGVNTGGGTGGASLTTSSSGLTVGQWSHIAVTLDRDGNGVIYINGIANVTAAMNPNDYSAVDIVASSDILIGNGNGYLNGKTSNLQVWNSNLSASQVTQLYNNGVPLTTAIATDNLKLWAKLDNTATFSTNWSIPDASGNGNTGTSSGMTEQNLVNNNVSALNGESLGMTSANLVLSDLTRAVPYDSYSFNFDSASVDYIDCGNPSELDITGSITLSCWVKSSNTAANYKLLIKDNGTSRSFQINTNHASLGPYTYFWLGGGNIRAVSTGVPNQIVDGNWHHIVSVFKSGEYIRMYIDGIQVGNTNVTETTLDSSTSNFIIATDGFGGTVGVDGKVSNVSVFNEALTSTEVLKLYSNGVPQDLSSFSPAPVAWYTLGSNSFWNGSQWTVRDMIGSNDGTGQNIGIDGLVGDSPRSSAGGTGTNIDIPTNLEGNTKWSDNNSWSINMSETARVEDTP